MKTIGAEENILTEFRQGKLELLYRKIYPGLLLFAAQLLNWEDDFMAEDCVQNAIFHAWQRREHFDTVYTLKSFLYISIKNEIISLDRKKKARNRYCEQLDNDLYFTNSVIDQETQLLLYNAIQALPEKERLVFEMSYIEGLKNVEIAKKLNVSDSTVKKTKARALEILRQKLSSLLFLMMMNARLMR